MAADIVPELYEKIQKTFSAKYEKAELLNEPIKNTLAKLEAGTATFRDADMYACEVGNILSETLKECIKLEDMPNGKFYYNIAERTVGKALQDEYRLASNVAGLIQESINEAHGIGLKAVVPEPKQYRVHDIVERASRAETQQALDTVLEKPVETFVRKASDDTMRVNADLHNKAGLEVRVEREYDGVGLHNGTDVCDWCVQRAGKWTYEQAKDNGVWERHEGCGCIIDYTSKKGKKERLKGSRNNSAGKIENPAEQEARIERTTKKWTVETQNGNLTKEEQYAVVRYKSPESYKLNDQLRTISKLEELSPDYQKWVHDLDSALEKMPLYNGTVLRVVDFSGYSDRKVLVDEFVNQYEEGKIINHKQFLSTSNKYNLNESADVNIFIENSRRGKDISKFGLDEGEVLFSRNETFITTRKVEEHGRWYILLEEI